MANVVPATRPGAVRRPSRSRPQRLGSRRCQWIGSGGAHLRLPTRRRSSERERESRTRGRSATRAWPFPRRGGGHRRRLASRQVRGAADGWVRGAADGWVCVKLCMGGEPGALAAASVGAPNGTDCRRSASDHRGSGLRTCAGRASARQQPAFFPGGRFTPSHNCGAVEGFSCTGPVQ